MIIHCLLHRCVLADKNVPTKLKAVLSPAKRMIYFLRESILNHHCLFFMILLKKGFLSSQQAKMWFVSFLRSILLTKKLIAELKFSRKY